MRRRRKARSRSPTTTSRSETTDHSFQRPIASTPARTRPLAGGGVRILPRRHHVPRSCLHCRRCAIHDGRAASQLLPDERVVFSAFTRTYSLFEIPSGWLGDTRGPRRVLTRIVLWWSAFTMLTGAAWGYASLGVTRFLFGAGEAGAFPNMARALGQWFPARERGQANGILFFGSRLGVDVSLLRDGAGVCGWRRGVAGHRSRTPAGRSHSLVVDVEPQ